VKVLEGYTLGALWYHVSAEVMAVLFSALRLCQHDNSWTAWWNFAWTCTL